MIFVVLFSLVTGVPLADLSNFYAYLSTSQYFLTRVGKGFSGSAFNRRRRIDQHSVYEGTRYVVDLCFNLMYF